MKRFFYQWLIRTVLALTCLLITTPAWADTWTVAGEPEALFGTTWDPANTANDMTNVGGTKYIFFKKNVTVTGTASFKACKDHAWTTAYPSNNYNLNCSSGTYDFLITFDSNSNDVKGVYSFTVAGSSTALFGTTWAPDNNSNNMTTTDGHIYTWTKENVELSAGNVEFKVCGNHAYDIAYPSNNKVLNISENGTYDVTITYNSYTDEVTATATAIQTTPDVYYVAGATNGTASGSNDALFGTAWNATGNEMTTTDDTHYTWTSGQATLSANDVVEFKVVKNGSEWIGDNGNNITCTATQNGIYTLTVTYTVDGTPVGTLNLVESIPDLYYVVGEPSSVFPNGWNIDDAQLMTANGTTWTWSKSPINLTDDATIAFKVKKKSGNTETWIPDGDNITVAPEYGAGNYALTINYVEGETPTAALTPLFVTTPVFSPAAGNYDSNQDVTITATSGIIYYTTDGSDPATSSTRVQYTAPIPMHHEDNFTFKAVAVDGNEVSAVAEADYTIKYKNIYLFGSVGIQHAWNFKNGNYELVTADGVNYTGVFRVNNTTNENVGHFILGSTLEINSWESQDIIGSDASAGYDWEINDATIGVTMNTVPSGRPWKVTTGPGLYEFDYNRSNNTLVVTKFHGISIFVYDYARPYIYAEDAQGTALNGEYPGANINIIDETVGGHSGMSAAGDGSGLGTGTLGWYEFPVASTHYPITYKFLHNGDNTVTETDFLTTSEDVYLYWNGTEYVKLNSREDADNLRRIVAHVRVQGTTVPTCNGVAMNGPSSFYGQMYYWMAVTKYDDGVSMEITDETHTYENENLTSDVYLEWTDASSENYTLLDKETLQHRLENKTGVGTIIHLQKNRNTVETHDSSVLGINTWVWSSSENTNINTTNLGRTWWGRHQSQWAGSVSGDNYANSRYIYQSNGLNNNPDVYIETSEDGAEWFTWYEDNSVASITFGYGTLTADATYPNYTPNKDKYQFYATYESPAVTQQAGELWYVWTPDFNNPGNDNGQLIDVTRNYESRAKQKALCSTVREGNFVYYTDIKGWGDDNIFCYIFDGTELLVGPWPGIQMTKIGYDDEGHPVYLIDLSNYNLPSASSTAGIIFNNGKEDTDNTKAQTGNLEWENGGCYDYLGLIYRIGGNIDVIENEPDGENSTLVLRGVWYSRVKGTLFAKGNNDYNNKSVNSRGYIDFARIVTDDGALQDWEYDQSNWVEIEPSESVSADDLKSLLEMDFTLYGTKLSSVNPRFKAISISDIENGGEYTPNHFTPAHFNGTCFQQRRGDNEWYFFVEPKPNEFALIDWTIYNAGAFHAYTNAGFDGIINVDWSYHDPTYKPEDMTDDLDASQLEDCGKDPHLTDLNGFSDWYAIIKFVEGTSSTKAATGDQFEAEDVSSSTNRAAKYTVYPIKLNDDMATAIETINADKASGVRSLKSTRYYNMMGVESSTPFQGVNIIVKEYTDGSRESSKVIMR